MKIKTAYKKKNIPPKILKQLWKLNFSNDPNSYAGSGSALLNILQEWVREIGNLKIVYIEDKNGKVLSWGAVSDFDIHIYTRKNYRRNGFGPKVYKHLMRGKEEKNIAIRPHDDISNSFYSKLRDKNNFYFYFNESGMF